MPKASERGFAHLLILLILAAGIVGGLYLVTHPQIFKSKATADGTRIEVVDDSGNVVTTVATQSAKLKLTYVPPATSARQVKTMLIAYVPPGGVSTVYPGAPVQDPENFVKNTMIPAMISGTKFHGYSNSAAQPEINFSLAGEDIHVINSTPPIRQDNYLNAPSKAANQPGYLDMATIFLREDICNVAKQKDIKMVILMMADYGAYAPKGFEDYITGSRNIPTNGPILRGPQYCDDKTIYIVAPVYTRGLAEALESYGHHLEGVFRHFNYSDYALWADEGATRNGSLVGRGDSCGTDHNPPNARQEYDAANTSNFQSDCRNWKADGTGDRETLNCSVWGCNRAGWLVWWMQNMPVSWWSYVADPDSTSLGSVAPAYPTNFRVANSPAFLNAASEQLFTGNGQTIDWMLSAGEGHKTIYGQFKVMGAWQGTISTTVELVGSSPSPIPSLTPTPTSIPTPTPTVTPSLTPTPTPSLVLSTLTASPNPVPRGGTSTCPHDPAADCGTTIITWNTGDRSDGQVWVSHDGGAETLFAQNVEGSQAAPWIQTGHIYVFKLYLGTSHTTVLGSPLTVTR